MRQCIAKCNLNTQFEEKKMKKMLTIFFAAACVGFMTTNIIAGDEVKGEKTSKIQKMCKGRGFGKRVMVGLNLDKEQREKIQGIRKTFQPQIQEASKSLEKARNDFRVAAMNSNSDDSTLKALSVIVGEKMYAKVQLRHKMLKAMKELLTEEQKVVFEKNLKKTCDHVKKQCEQRQDRRGKRKGRKHGRGQGAGRRNNNRN